MAYNRHKVQLRVLSQACLNNTPELELLIEHTRQFKMTPLVLAASVDITLC